MQTWKGIFRESLTRPAEFASALALEPSLIERVLSRYPALVNPYFKELCDAAGAPLARQVLPDALEISAENEAFPEDPIGEDAFSPVPNLSHRYEDRVLFLISDICPVFCRFCTRKRKVGRSLSVSPATIDEGIIYIRDCQKVRDVLLSGGDPLMLDDPLLDSILGRVRAIDHVEIIRIGSRVPAALPQRVTARLASILSRHGPLFLHLHFNHPEELTGQARDACLRLTRAGIPLASQTVLLKGINDNPDTLEALFRGLLTMRVRPYYLFQCDTVRGTAHFRTPLGTGIRIMQELRKRTSPMALPLFVVDLPGGAGKSFPALSSVEDHGQPGQAIITPDGQKIPYPDP